MEKRIAVRKRYLENLSNVKGIVVPFADCKEFTSNYIMPVVLTEGNKERRNAIREKIHEAGIQTSVHYPAVQAFTAYQGVVNETPLAQFVADHELTLPLYPTMTIEEVDLVCDALIKGLAL